MPSNDVQNVHTVQFSRSAPIDHTYADKTEGGDTVDIEKYLDRLDQDRRESEQRITENQRLSDDRYDKRMEEIEARRRESEERYQEQRKEDEIRRRESEERYQKQREEDEIRRRESEERYQKQREEDEARHRDWMKSTEEHFKKMDEKLDNIATEVRNDGRESKRWLLGTFIAVAAMAIATIGSIVAIVVTLP